MRPNFGTVMAATAAASMTPLDPFRKASSGASMWRLRLLRTWLGYAGIRPHKMWLADACLASVRDLLPAFLPHGVVAASRGESHVLRGHMAV